MMICLTVAVLVSSFMYSIDRYTLSLVAPHAITTGSAVSCCVVLCYTLTKFILTIQTQAYS